MAFTRTRAEGHRHLPMSHDTFICQYTGTVLQTRLALTLNDVKKAQLLAEFAAERIAEANILLKEGKTDLAKQALQMAAETQENIRRNPQPHPRRPGNSQVANMTLQTELPLHQQPVPLLLLH